MNSLISRINLSNSFFFFRVFELADLSERSFIFYKKKARACLSRCGTHLFDLYLTGHHERSFKCKRRTKRETRWAVVLHYTIISIHNVLQPQSHTHGWKRYWTKLSIHLCHWRRLILILLIKWEFYFLLYFWRCSITTPRSFKRIHIRAAKLFFFGGSRVSLRATMTRLSSATKGQRRRSCRIPFGSPQFSDNSRRTMTKSRERRATQQQKKKK
jgi:hypothetical protein